MNVRMAAQVLSETVGSFLQKFCPDARETAAFCSLMDGFFDIVNIKNMHEADRKLKPFLKPFSYHDDSRFDWLRRVFLKYFEDWLERINSRPGNFKADARSKMFLSWQMYKGIKITVHSVIELVQFLLSKNVPYRKIPIISAGLILFRKPFLGGLLSGGGGGGAYYRDDICV